MASSNFHRHNSLVQNLLNLRLSQAVVGHNQTKHSSNTTTEFGLIFNASDITYWYTYMDMYRVRKSLPESSAFQFSVKPIAGTDTNDTWWWNLQKKNPLAFFNILKVGVALLGGRHALLPQKAYFD